jgi:uncharacterized membrane protein YfcA
MMEFIVVAIASLFASGLTLFSGFGLGTLLLPVFALFFPVEVAIGMTAVVHFLNNVLKLILLGKYAKKEVVLKFGLPAIVTAFFGAIVLIWFSGMEPIFSYRLFDRMFSIQPVQFIIGILILIFVFVEMLPKFKNIAIDKKYLPLGGIISGFFGGLSGHQGALRSMFLLKAGLNKESFIATGVIIASLVDFSRLIVYSSRIGNAFQEGYILLLLVAVIAAFLGVFIGNRLLQKVTMKTVQIIISVLLIVIAFGLISGII